jgi:hypothetical protein
MISKYSPFEKFKEAWQFQIVADHNLSAHTLRVAFVIGSHLNRDSREAWPGMAVLIRRTGVARNTVIRSIQRLEVAEHLRVVRSRATSGKNFVNHYQPLLKRHAQNGTTLVPKLRHYPSAKAMAPKPLTQPLIEPLPNGSDVASPPIQKAANRVEEKRSSEETREGGSVEKTLSSSATAKPNKPNPVSQCYALARKHYPGRESLIAKALRNNPAADVLAAITEAIEADDDIGNALGGARMLVA